jgi:type I restriction enzyme S subunit
MKQGWVIKKLGDVSTVSSGNSAPQKKELFEDGIFPFIRTSDVGQIRKGFISSCVDYLNKDGIKGLKLYKKGTILFPKSGASTFLNHRVMMEIDSYVSSHLATIKGNNSIIDDRFLLYFLTTIDARDLMQDIAYPSLKTSDISLIPIPLPPLPEQQRIVAILDEAFDTISKAKSNAEQNLKNAKQLYESYLQGVFVNPKDNWEMKKWGDLCHFVRGPFGGSLKKSVFKEEGFVVYEQKHAIHDHFNQLRYFIDEEKFNEMIRFEVKPGDIIMSCSGVTLGRVAVIPEGIKPGIINQALLKLTPKKNVLVHFLKHWLRSKIFQDIIFEYSGGAAIPNVPAAKILKDILIPLPSLQEQKRIVDEIELMLTETQKLEIIYQQKIADLEELKKSILQKAFNGELKTSTKAITA